MRNKMATPDLTVTEREKKHIAISTEIAAEGIVLLENRGVLPLSADVKSIALFGSGARRTVKGGTGSGDVNTRSFVTVERGLKNAGFSIVTDAWLLEHETVMVEAKKAYDDHIQELSHQGIGVALLTMMGQPFVEPEFRALGLSDLAKADAAIYVLARNSGEGADRKNAPGDYQLTENEKKDIALLAQSYSHFVLLLNVGGVVDIEPVQELPDAIVLMSQGGSGCGDAVAKVLTGEENPSGKLTATWAKRYEDYPFAEEFAADANDAYYKEGIYVGYRWFDTFGIEPMYPFGYGLSYTDFKIETTTIRQNRRCVDLCVRVTNTGKCPGKEVVQVYASFPQTDLDKPYQSLVAFEKTVLLKPGEVQELPISINLSRMASYDESRSAWVLEQGCYILRVGNHSRYSDRAVTLKVDKDCIVEQCRNLLRREHPEKLPEERDSCLVPNCPVISIDTSKLLCVKHEYTQDFPLLPKPEKLCSFADVVKGRATAEELVGQMTADELIQLCIGGARVSLSDFSVIGNASKSIPGAAGDTTGKLSHYSIPQCAMADGPAGIRVNPKVYERHDGYINNVEEDPILGKVLPPELRKVNLSGTRVKYQYCTALPIATQLAQTWNHDLLLKAGDLIGAEMEQLGIDLWLAPGMNIQRNPLCGRNFEYFSEDPLLSGLCAADLIVGVQENHPGKGVTVKHFAANNQETNRNRNNSHVSERVLREIYLKGFEIAVKHYPFAVMTSVNLLNGIHTANDRGLLLHILRDEWWFKGLVMTDWGTTGEFVENSGDSYSCSGSKECIQAGNDLIMPGTQGDEDRLKAAVENGTLHIESLQACAVRIINVLKRCAPGMEE